ncbi:MAG: flagellar biosynthetic protein FliO [Kangiellaceae bacterium]|nr:flagellar biosynthetic protein FliO [Kangiellaceae bacterium]
MASMPLASSYVIAAPSNNYPPELGMGQVVKTFVALVFVLGCIFFIGWAMQRLQKLNPSRSSAIKVVSVTPLSTKERLVLVQAGEVQILLGVSAGKMDKLHVFDQPIVVENSNEEAPFASKLNQYLKRSQQE